MDINPRLLSLKLKREVVIRSQLKTLRKSSNKTLNTIYETAASSFSSINEFQDVFYEEEKETDEEDSLQKQYNLFKSFPSLEWTQKIENSSESHQDRRRKKSKRKKNALDKIHGLSEAKIESLDQLQLLEELSETNNSFNDDAPCVGKRLALRARESQIRRRIFSLQRYGESIATL